jgi:uncharacterized protein YceH (UPF0502 family)
MEYQLDPTERRIVGVLIEKETTTPEAYPLSLQALVTGCNQKSNRDPVTSYATFEIEGALRSLFQKRWVTTTNLHGRIEKWKHRVTEHLSLPPEALAILAELLLRGPQNPGELRSRASRMAGGLLTLEHLNTAFGFLRDMHPSLVTTHAILPGERVARMDHCLYLDEEAQTPSISTSASRQAVPTASDTATSLKSLEARLALLEQEAAVLRAIVDELLQKDT